MVRHALVFLSLLVLVFSEIEKEDGVLVLTADNFESAITDNEYVLVEFYAPWCGHCKALAPEYAKAAQKLDEEGSNIKLAKVDATAHTALATKYEVQGYPTLKFFKKANAVEYNGPRESAGIVSWLKKKTGPAMTVCASKDELEKYKKEHKLFVVYQGADESSAKYKTALETADVSDFFFAHLKEGPEQLTIYRQFDEPEMTFSGEWNTEAVKKWIKAANVPLVTEFSQETAQVVFESDIKMHILAFSGKKNSDYDEHKKLLHDVAKRMRGKLHVVILDLDDGESVRIGEFFGIKPEDAPTFRVLNMETDMKKFQPDDKEFTADAIVKFAERVIKGDVKPHLKSQDEPADWDSQPVKVLVAKTFEQRAVNKDKAVFIEFYAPWCGHCKALAPIWDDLAIALKDDADVIIAKLDATENELETVSISSFPTLKFSPKGRTDFIDYSGGRTKDELLKFVKSNGEEGNTPKEEDSEEEKHDEL